MRKLLVVLLAFGLILAGAGARAGVCEEPVMTAEGAVQGVEDTAEEVCVYKGIPYAAPPVGENRWRPPQPPQLHSEVLQAWEFGPRCLSSGAGSGAPQSMLPAASEDCLFLNIWRPKKSGVFPVMVWIHGGSLEVGTAAEPLYWGERLAGRQEVVLVSINYRLNYYGFLAHPGLSAEDPAGSSGNYGLLDQIAALQWVQANIAGFGGDPGNVTIFGESAGGWSVCTLLASPLAAGLFHRAVIQSGGCDAVKSLEEGFADGEKFVRSVGCEGEGVLSCLRAKSPEAITLALMRAEKKEKKPKRFSFESIAGFQWVPHVDGYALRETPKEALRSGRFNQVPLMAGSNRDEVKLFVATIPGARMLSRSVIRKGYAGLFGEEVLVGTEALYSWSEYKRPMDLALDAAGDMALGCPCWEAAAAAAAFQPVFYYRFDFHRHLAPDLAGACHGLEIAFVFNNLDKFPVKLFLTAHQKKKAQELSAVMMAFWANFARRGDPNGPGLPLWPSYNAEKPMRMFFDLESEARPADNLEKCLFWRETGWTILGRKNPGAP